MRIGVLGTGTIATAVVRGIAPDGHKITVSDRSKSNSAALSAEFENVTVADNQTVLDQSDIVFLGLMAEMAREILGSLQFRPHQRIITFMAGASLEQTDALVNPASAVAIMMPFPKIAEGDSAVMMQGDADLVRDIFGARNSIFELADDAELAAYLCAQAVLSPVVSMVETAAGWLGARVSDPSRGEEFLRTLVSSSLSGSQCAPLLDALNTPGGYNQRLRQHVENSGLRDALAEGLNKLESGK